MIYSGCSSPQLPQKRREIDETRHGDAPSDEYVRDILHRICVATGADCGTLVRLDGAGAAGVICVAADGCKLPAKISDQWWNQGSFLEQALRAETHCIGNVDVTGTFFWAGAIKVLAAPIRVHGLVKAELLLETQGSPAFDGILGAGLDEYVRIAVIALASRLDQEVSLLDAARSRQLAALGESLAAIIHEVNNPLTAVLGMASLLESGGALRTPDDMMAVNAIMSEARRAAEIVQRTLSFSRSDSTECTRCDLNEIVQQIAQIKAFNLRQRFLRVEAHPIPKAAWVWGCRSQILQALLNLVSNAEHAIAASRRDGRITLAVASRPGLVLVRVEDNGSGIPADVQRRIFEPFFTTKSDGEGTGLGLAIARSAVMTHGGALILERSSAAGTVFRVEFPALKEDETVLLGGRH